MNNLFNNFYLVNMEKKKSQKRINQTLNNHSKKEESPMRVKNILKQIGELKKDIVSIKSKKYLQTLVGNIQSSNNTNKKQHQFSKEGQLSFQYDLQSTNKAGKQNKDAQCACKIIKTNEKEQNIKSKDIKILYEKTKKIDLLGISCTKQRQVKLKANIQISKIKSAFEKLIVSCQQSQLIELIAAQFNVMMTYLNSIIKEYEKQITEKKNEYKEMRIQLSSITNKVLKLTQGHSSQKNLTASQMEEIAELKRYLSYYMQLIQDNKMEAEQSTKDYADLEIYVHQIQRSNEIVKKQLKFSKQKIQQLNLSMEKKELELQNYLKNYKMLQSDLQLSKIQVQKNRGKYKQIDDHYAIAVVQLKKCNEKIEIKQLNIVKKEEENKKLMEMINNLKDQNKNLSLCLTRQKIQAQKLQRKCSMLDLNLTKKQQILHEQEQELQNTKSQYEKLVKFNKKLTENLQFCQIQIDNLSEQIDDLKKANEKYKNQLFRNKLLQVQTNTSTKNEEVISETRKKFNHRAEIKIKKQEYQKQGSPLSLKSKHRQKILGEIQQLIEKHKKSSDSQQQQDSSQQYQ